MIWLEDNQYIITELCRMHLKLCVLIPILCVYLIIYVAVGLVFFFFQAEDGIRDLTVTGVQTCALPISACKSSWSCTAKARLLRKALWDRIPILSDVRPGQDWNPIPQPVRCAACISAQIGRASCRERV